MVFWAQSTTNGHIGAGNTSITAAVNTYLHPYLHPYLPELSVDVAAAAQGSAVSGSWELVAKLFPFSQGILLQAGQ